MDNLQSDLLEKVRQQFDNSPFPRISLDTTPKYEYNMLYKHNLVTSYYLRNQRFIDTKDKIILDAGCGTGYTSLILAEANPGAKIIGIDISKESINLAEKRLEYHGFSHVEFHVLSIYDLNQLNEKFDYINCDETLSLIPEPALALQAMKSVLKPDGIIRANLHSYMQRFVYYRAQKLFQILGLMDGDIGELETKIVAETMKALHDNIYLKAQTWRVHNFEGENGQEQILMNYLLQGDKGYTIPEMFNLLQTADLEFISMVNWREWNLFNLFKEPDNLPIFLGLSLPELSTQEQLQIFELLHPRHRLLDFWCGHPNQGQDFVPIYEWDDTTWQQSTVYIHPQLKHDDFIAELTACMRENQIFTISKHLSQIEQPIDIDCSTATCLIPLLEQPQSMLALVQYWQQLRPIDPLTLQPVNIQQSFEAVKKILSKLEGLGYVMLEN